MIADLSPLIRILVQKPACGRLLFISRPTSGDGTSRQLDVKRPNRTSGIPAKTTSPTRRQTVKVDWFRVAPTTRPEPKFPASRYLTEIFVRKVENQAVRVCAAHSGTQTVSSHFARPVYFFGVYPCHTYSNAWGRVCAFTARSQWLAFLAKTNW